MWWIPAALAHAPHEVVVSAAAPADLAEGSWFLLSTNEGLHLQRSKDQGRSWEMVGGAPLEDELQELAEVQGTVLALAPGRLWWTVDQGESWQKQSLPASIVDIQGGERLLLVGDGIWGGSPETLQKEAEGSFVRVGAGGVVTAADGGIWRALPEWTQVATLAGAVDALVAGEQLYALDAQRRLYRWEEGWTACAEVEEGGIFSMATDGQGGLLVGGVNFAPYYSADACQSWERRDPPESVVYDQEGGASGPSKAYPVLLAAGNRWLVAGWFGMWHSDDQGQHWLDSPLTPPDFIRGLAVRGERIYKGGYSYGVAFTDDGGQSFSAPNLGMLPPNSQILLPRPESETVYAVVNHRGWTSLDAGVHWTPWLSSDALDHIRSWAILWDGSLVVDAKTGVWFTEDEGATLQSRSDLDALLDGEPVIGVAAWSGGDTGGTPACCVGTETRVLCLSQGEAEFRLRHSSAGPLTPPVAGPGGIWVGGPEGLQQVDSVESLDLPVQAEKIFVSADGSLSFTTRAADLYHRRPTDTAWRYIAQLPAPIAEIVEDPAAESTLLLGTHDGIWRLGDLAGESPTLERWGAWERVDGGSDFIRWSPTKPSVKVEEEADFGELHPLRAGVELRVWLRGSRLQIRGTSEVGARALVRLDGEPVATLEHDGTEELRVLWSSEELAEGWHMLELVGVWRGLAIDSLDGCTAPTEAACTVAAAPRPTPPPEKKDCGCQNGGAAWLWLGAIGLARRQSTQR